MILNAVVIMGILSLICTAIGVAIATARLIRKKYYDRNIEPPERLGLF